VDFFEQGDGIVVHPSTNGEQAVDAIPDAAQKEWESSLCVKFGTGCCEREREKAFVNAGNEQHLFFDYR
jgi:hypothetical protein